MKEFRILYYLSLSIISALFVGGIASAANSVTEPAGPNAGTTSTIPPGTVITAQNWQQYRQFMPDGMVVLFQGNALMEDA